MGLIARTIQIVSDTVGAVIVTVGRAVGLVADSNRNLTVRFEVVSAARTNGATIPATTELDYVPVPAGTWAGLHQFAGNGTPDGQSIVGARLARAQVGENGTVTFGNMPTVPPDLLYVALEGLPIDPEQWDSKFLNFYREWVAAVDVPAGHGPIRGVFTASELADHQVTFRVRGLPVHTRITYTMPNPGPGFGGDPGAQHLVQDVPMPTGVEVALCRELPPDVARPVMRGRTGTGAAGIRETVWNAVLYKPLDPPIADAVPDPLKPDTVVAIHVKMDMEQEGLSPIRVRGLPYVVPNTPERPWELPVVEVRSDTRTLDLQPEVQNLALGTRENPFEVNVNESSFQVGRLPDLAGAPPLPLGHQAVFALQAIADVHRWFWLMSKNAGKDAKGYQGVALDVLLWQTWGTLNTVSWPPELIAEHPLFLESRHWNVHSVIGHEFCHQISYGRGLLSEGLPHPDWLTEMPTHYSEKYTTTEIALLEGWAEFVEALFGRVANVLPIERFDSGMLPATARQTELWDEPNAGEKVEGCVARALFQAYKALHDRSPIGPLAAVQTSPAGTELASGGELVVQAFVDANGSGTVDPGERLLSDWIVEFVGANRFRVTDSSGEARLGSPHGEVTGESAGPALIAPAARTQTSGLDGEQDALRPLDPGLFPQTAGLFSRLFFDPWYPNVAKAEEVYGRMQQAALETGGDVYDRLNRIFWDNDMRMPRVVGRLRRSLLRLGLTPVWKLEDALGRPVRGTFPFRVVQSTNPADLTTQVNEAIVGPFAGNDVMGETDAEGEIVIRSVTLDPATRAALVDINVRSLIPRADAADHDVWVRGAFPR